MNLAFLRRLLLWLVCIIGPVMVAQAAPKIAVFIGDATSPFGQVLVDSFREAADREGVVLTLKSPPLAENVAQSQKLIASWEKDPEIRGLIIACGIGGTELAKAAEVFRVRGLPIVAMLGRMPEGVARSSILVDENAVIAAAVKHCAELIHPGDEIALMRSNIRQGVANDRERLAMVGLRERYPTIVIHADIFMNFEGKTAQEQAVLLLQKYPGTKLVYSPYSSATTAMIGALRDTGLAGKVQHVGISAGIPKECVDALRKGELNTLIALDPRDVAFKAMVTMTAILAGKDVSEIVLSDVKVVTGGDVPAAQMSR